MNSKGLILVILFVGLFYIAILLGNFFLVHIVGIPLDKIAPGYMAFVHFGALGFVIYFGYKFFGKR